MSRVCPHCGRAYPGATTYHACGSPRERRRDEPRECSECGRPTRDGVVCDDCSWMRAGR